MMNFSKRLERILYDLYLSVYYWLEAIVKYCIPHRYYSKDLGDEIVLITGSASGIGRELALELAPQVKKLILWDLNENGLKESLTLLQEKCGECDCLAFKVDITNRVEVYKTAELVRKSLVGQKVSMVINNAGVVSGKNFIDLSDEDIIKSFDVNVLSNFWINKAFLPDMIAQNRGHIVTMASVASFFGVPKLTDYSSSKSAVYMLHETLACELRSLGIKGIKFTAICPFLVNTKMFQGAYSPLLSTLNSEYVVEKIIQAIKIEQFVLAMPRIIYFFLWMKQLVPVASGYFMLRLSGFIDLMSNFTQKNTPLSNGIKRKIR